MSIMINEGPERHLLSLFILPFSGATSFEVTSHPEAAWGSLLPSADDSLHFGGLLNGDNKQTYFCSEGMNLSLFMLILTY